MYQRLKAYLAHVEKLLADADAQDNPITSAMNWDDVAREHLVQISFFQHERMVHLLVTLAFAGMELACALVCIAVPSLTAAALMLLFLVPLVPYVVHYYHLENGTQRLYGQYDRIVSRARACGEPDWCERGDV